MCFCPWKIPLSWLLDSLENIILLSNVHYMDLKNTVKQSWKSQINFQWTQMDRKKVISGLVQKAVGLFSGVTTLLSAPSPLISLQLSWDKLYYKQGNAICHSPPPTIGSLGTVIFSWFMNLKEVEEETCFSWISMPALMYPSLVKTNNLLFLTRQKVRLLLSTLIVWLERKKKNIYIYIKNYIKSEFQEESILIKRDVLHDTCMWGKKKFNHCGSQPLLGKAECWNNGKMDTHSRRFYRVETAG